MNKRTRRVISIDKKVPVNPEVVNMMRERHEAHRRGMFVVLGSISLMDTAHGVVRFPVINQLPSGPTIGYVTDLENGADPQKLVVLTEWNGLPDLIEKTEEFCTACLADCFICGTVGTKICEGVNCGGRGWTPGPSENCSAPGCLKETGKFKADCETCGGSGLVAPPVACIMCKGAGTIVCPLCKGQTRYSTGIKGGSTDFMQGRCPECNGQQRKVNVKPQRLEDHINALLPDPKAGPIAAIGPIFSFIVDLTEEQREAIGTPVKIFDIKPDGAGDSMFLLIDSSSSPKWPYLVGGMITDRVPVAGGAAGELPRSGMVDKALTNQ